MRQLFSGASCGQSAIEGYRVGQRVFSRKKRQKLSVAQKTVENMTKLLLLYVV